MKRILLAAAALVAVTSGTAYADAPCIGGWCATRHGSSPTGALPDGTTLVTVNGNDGNFIIPGAGSVHTAIGRVVYVADATGTPLEYLHVSGRYDLEATPWSAELCGYLGGDA